MSDDLLPYCRVFDNQGEYSDLPASEYPRILEAMKKHVTYRDDEVIESTLLGSSDTVAFRISTVIGICLRTPEGLRAAWGQTKAFEEERKRVTGWEE